MAAWRPSDPSEDPDVQRVRADLERLRYMPWRDEDAKREIERCIRVNRKWLARWGVEAA